MNIRQIAVLKPFIFIGDTEIKILNKLSRREGIDIMEENDIREVKIKKISNGFVFEIVANKKAIIKERTFFAPTRTEGIKLLEKKLREFGKQHKEEISRVVSA